MIVLVELAACAREICDRSVLSCYGKCLHRDHRRSMATSSITKWLWHVFVLRNPTLVTNGQLQAAQYFMSLELKHTLVDKREKNRCTNCMGLMFRQLEAITHQLVSLQFFMQVRHYR